MKGGHMTMDIAIKGAPAVVVVFTPLNVTLRPDGVWIKMPVAEVESAAAVIQARRLKLGAWRL